MKTTILKTVMLALATILITACGKDDDTPITPPQEEPKVYVVGYQENSNGIPVATLWVDGVAQEITDGTNRAYATSVYVDGNDIYIAGFEILGNTSVHKVWKNGVATNYADTRYLSSVFVNENNVYVSGWDIISGKSVAKVWENGVATSLTDVTTHISRASDVFVHNNNVYVVGEDFDGTNTYASLWTNGVVTHLNSIDYGEAKAVFVDQGDVYVVGYTSNGNSSITGKIWKNGVATALPGINYVNTSLNDVFVYNNDVYAIGTDGNDDIDPTEIPTLWKNGVPTHIATSNTNRYPNVNALYVHNDNTYIVGAEWNSNNIYVAKVWINGEETLLTDGTTRANASAIYVK